MAEEQNQSVGAPPPPEMTIRTMASDLKSLESSGGMGATPQAFTPALDEQIPALSAPPAAIPGYTGPEKAIFEPAAVIEINPPVKERSKTVRIVWAIAGILALIAIFGFVGYYFISPWLFPPQMPPVQ